MFLKTALNAQRRARGEKEMDAMSVLKRVRGKAAELKVSEEMLKRALNVGFSGGEKKRAEILQNVTVRSRRWLCSMRGRFRPRYRRAAFGCGRCECAALI